MRVWRFGLLCALAVVAGCTAVLQRSSAGESAAALARSVTISRDEWGVPYIRGATDASVAFGIAYAQAEDNYWQIEEDYIHALGLASNWYGERYLAADLLKAAFEVERLSRAEYAREPPERKAVWNAFAAGLNYYMRTAGVRPRLIAQWEPWMLFAPFRALPEGTVIDGVRLGRITELGAASGNDVQLVGAWDGSAAPAPSGSNAWAVAPARSASGHALLFQNPHVPFFGTAQRYELQVDSDEGWHFRGFAILGTPVPRAGHNAQLGWSHTNTGADYADVYAVTFDHPADPASYRYDGEWRRATEWADTVQVNTMQGVETRVYKFRRTHHGPIVAVDDGRALAVRIARLEDGGSLQQWYAMNRARDLEQFRGALSARALPISNTMYADVQGNIYYLHGNAVPVRDTTFDWSRPVDGNTARTEWRGYHELDELPQLLNPPGGWLQNTNATPFRAAVAADNLVAVRYPGYMASEPDNERARASRRLLAGDTSWTFEEWARAAFDTYVNEAEALIGPLVLEWEEVGGRNPERAMKLDDAIDLLRGWDRVSTIESPAMALFVLWQERLRSGDYNGAFVRVRALEDALAQLQRDWDTAHVAWGDINRLQRVHTSGLEPFRDDSASLPIAGAPGWTGVIFRVEGRPGPTGKRYGQAGHTWVSVVEFAPRVRARSIMTFGQSANPASPHFFDQAPLYARGALKDAWLYRDDVAAHARRTYHPGQSVAPGAAR